MSHPYSKTCNTPTVHYLLLNMTHIPSQMALKVTVCSEQSADSEGGKQRHQMGAYRYEFWPTGMPS